MCMIFKLKPGRMAISRREQNAPLWAQPCGHKASACLFVGCAVSVPFVKDARDEELIAAREEADDSKQAENEGRVRCGELESHLVRGPLHAHEVIPMATLCEAAANRSACTPIPLHPMGTA